VFDLLKGTRPTTPETLKVEARHIATVETSFTEDGCYLVTSTTSLHGRFMSQPGRVMVQFGARDGRSLQQRYVMAEGPIRSPTSTCCLRSRKS
jgi:hypothetical protein